MVAPTTGIVKRIIDEMAVQLDTVDGLRVYKYPVDSVQEFPAAIIRDNQATNQTVVAEYRSTSPEGVYHLEVDGARTLFIASSSRIGRADSLAWRPSRSREG